VAQAKIIDTGPSALHLTGFIVMLRNTTKLTAVIHCKVSSVALLKGREAVSSIASLKCLYTLVKIKNSGRALSMALEVPHFMHCVNMQLTTYLLTGQEIIGLSNQVPLSAEVA